MISKQAKDFINSVDTPGRVLEINLDSIPVKEDILWKEKVKSMFNGTYKHTCEKCGGQNCDSYPQFCLRKCNDCGDITTTYLKLPKELRDKFEK